VAIVDEIIVDRDGTPTPITVIEWKTLPLSEQIRLISEKRVGFFAGGNEVRPREALSSLKN